jgi:hypothetical protein
MSVPTDDPLVLIDIDLDADPPAEPARRRSRRWWRRRCGRRLVEPAALVVLAAVGYVAAGSVGARSVATDGGGPRHPPVAAPAAARGPAPEPTPTLGTPPADIGRLIAPATAEPGEQITIVGFRSTRLCGGTACGRPTVDFDGAIVATRQQDGSTPHSGWVDVLLSLTVPATATPGRHQISLIGPVGSGTPSVERLLATAEIVIPGETPDQARASRRMAV